MRILIVDDDPTCLAASRGALESRGHEVVESETGFGTAALVLAKKPDLVLLDLEMPGLGGHQIVQVIREYCKRDAQPMIVLYSGREIEELERIARESTADGAIQKSTSPTDFLSHLDQIISRRPLKIHKPRKQFQ